MGLEIGPGNSDTSIDVDAFFDKLKSVAKNAGRQVLHTIETITVVPEESQTPPTQLRRWE